MKILNSLRKKLIHGLAINCGYTPIEEIIKVFGGLPRLYPDGELLEPFKQKGVGAEFFKLGPYKGIYFRIIEESDKANNWLYFHPSDFVECKTNDWAEIMYYVNQIKGLKEGKKCLTSQFKEINTSGFC